jgi:hypothetical protein
MDKKEWRRRLRTLDDLSRYGQAIIDKLEEYDICNVTISKIIILLKGYRYGEVILQRLHMGLVCEKRRLSVRGRHLFNGKASLKWS